MICLRQFGWNMVCFCISCLADIGSYAGIMNSSPTLGTELLNLVPGFTYILAIIFRFHLLLLLWLQMYGNNSCFRASVWTIWTSWLIPNLHHFLENLVQRDNKHSIPYDLYYILPFGSYACSESDFCRMEGLNLRRSSDISKSLGTLVSIAGASVVTLYKGPAIMNKAMTLGSSGLVFSSQENWILGGILLATAAFSTAAWSIVQVWLFEMLKAEYNKL